MSGDGRFKPGQSGNPDGRTPYHRSPTRDFDKKWDERDPKDRRNRTYGQQCVDRLFDVALRGPKSVRTVNALREIFDRRLGKAVQAVAIADLRPESREQLIESILAQAQAAKKDESGTIQ